MAYAGSDEFGTTGSGSANCDPLAGAPGAHPLGTAIGAAAGGVAGKGAAEQVNPTDPSATPRVKDNGV